MTKKGAEFLPQRRQQIDSGSNPHRLELESKEIKADEPGHAPEVSL